MYPAFLRLMRAKVRTGEYVMTLHAEEEMDSDGFTIFDVENGILTGSIVERQRDTDTGEWKYVVDGETLDHTYIGIVAKLSPTNKLVIITIYGEET